MQGSIPRLRLQEEIKVKLKESPVVALLGARQVGKTTLARKISESLKEEVTFFDLESPSGRAPLIETPELALRSCTGTVVIDEIQRMPDLFEILRPLCDDPERKSRFLLLGSAAPELVRGVSESLAGRVLFVNVPGLSLQEVGTENQDRLWHRGGWRAFNSFTRLSSYSVASIPAFPGGKVMRWMGNLRSRTFTDKFCSCPSSEILIVLTPAFSKGVVGTKERYLRGEISKAGYVFPPTVTVGLLVFSEAFASMTTEIVSPN